MWVAGVFTRSAGEDPTNSLENEGKRIKENSHFLRINQRMSKAPLGGGRAERGEGWWKKI